MNNVTPAPGGNAPTLPPFSLPTLPAGGGFSIPSLPPGFSIPAIPEGFSLPEGFTVPSLSGLVVPPLCADRVSYPQCPGTGTPQIYTLILQ